MGSSQAKNAVVLAWAETLLHAAHTRGAPLRALGGIGVYLKCPQFRPLMDRYRDPLSDVDLVTARSGVHTIVGIFAEHGFEENLHWRTLFGHQRRVFYTPENLSIELFIDRLYFCQQIDVRDHLAGPEPTLSPTDLFLSRIQKIGLARKDLVDLNVLLAAHEVDGPGAETLDLGRIVGLAGRSWPWWRTLTVNLEELHRNRPPSLCTNAELEQRIRVLRASVERCPRSLPWKIRALLGDWLPWYRTVE